MTNPQSRRPTSESSADDPRTKSPNVSDAHPSSPDARPRRIGVYERLGRSTGLSPGMTLGVAIAIIGIIIVIIVMSAR
jgi:hypothetical protein